MSAHQAHGPLDSARAALQFFAAICGFSLCFKAGPGPRFHFSWMRYLVQIGVIAVLEMSTAICCFFLMVNNPEDFTWLWEESGNSSLAGPSNATNATHYGIGSLFNEDLTNLDKIIMAVSPMAGNICLTSLLFIWSKKAEDLLELNNKFLQVSHYFNASQIGTKSAKRAKKKVWVIYALTAATSLMFILFWQQAMPDNVWRNDQLLTIVTLASVPFTMFAGAINPALVCSLYLLTFFITYMSEHFAYWTDKLRAQLGENGKEKIRGSKEAFQKVYTVTPAEILGNEGSKDGPLTFEITKHMEIGFKLCKIAQYLNQCLGSTIFLYFCTSLAGSVAGLFAFSTILFHITNALLQYFSLAYGLMGIVFILLVYFACSAGQNLENQRVAAREQLDLYHTRYVSYLSDGQRFQLKILSERLEKFGTLKPLAYFHVNHSTHLGGISTMITYLIVLMQFKVSNVVTE